MSYLDLIDEAEPLNAEQKTRIRQMEKAVLRFFGERVTRNLSDFEYFLSSEYEFFPYATFNEVLNTMSALNLITVYRMPPAQVVLTSLKASTERFDGKDDIPFFRPIKKSNKGVQG